MTVIINLGIALLALLIGYLMGSFPTAVVIGKVFFKKDVRNYGSGNAGGTNAGRVFGRKVGLTVMILDILKSVAPVWIMVLLVRFVPGMNDAWLPWSYYLAAAGEMLGHCYPVFAKFKGGKAVSSFGGFVLATNWILAIFGIGIMLLVLKIKKHVSLASMVASSLVSLMALFSLLPAVAHIGFYPGMEGGFVYELFLLAGTLYLYARHHANIDRLLDHAESRVRWIDY